MQEFKGKPIKHIGFLKEYLFAEQKTKYSVRNNWFTIPYRNPSPILHKFLREIVYDEGFVKDFLKEFAMDS